MENTLSIVNNIKNVCGELGTVSQQTLSSADDIFRGAEQQKQSVSDLEQVMETLTHVFGKLYETMTEKCAKTEVSSALTFYNDKQYNKLLKGYEDDLDIMEDRIKEMEDKYYKQFTAMEKAMSQLQSQQNSLASLLGQTVQ